MQEEYKPAAVYSPALGVVVVIDLVARPVALALDAEMVVRLQRQPAVAAVGL